MPRLLRYRLVNVGDAAATYPDVLFEPEGDSFCIIQPNGTGKSTAVKFLLHALVNGRYVDHGSRRKLEEYLVPEGRVAHVVLEFGEPVAVPRGSERRVLVGLAVDRRRQENRKLHYLITFGPQHAVRWAERGIGLDASTLPLVETRRSVTEQGELQVWSPRSLERLRDFLEEQKDDHDGQVYVFAPGSGGWEVVAETLRRYHLDEQVLREIAYLNRQESSFDRLVEDHPTSASLIDNYILKRIETEDLLDGLREHAGQVQQQLTHLPGVERSLTVFGSLERHQQALAADLEAALRADALLTEAEQKWADLRLRACAALCAVRQVRAQNRTRCEELAHTAAHIKSEAEAAAVRLLAAKLRDAQRAQEAAVQRRHQTQAAHEAAQRAADTVQAIEHLIQGRQAESKAAAFAETLASLGDAIADKHRKRDHAARQLRARLDRLIDEYACAGQQVHQELVQCRSELQTLNSQREQKAREEASARAEEEHAREWLLQAGKKLAGSGFATPTAATAALGQVQAESAAAKVEAKAAADAVERDRDTAQQAAAAVQAAEKNRHRAEIAHQELLQKGEVERAARAPAAAALGRQELDDIHREGRDAIAALSHRIADAEQQAYRRHVQLQRLEAETQYFARTGRMRPHEDVMAVADALEQAGVAAQPGDAWLREVPGFQEEDRLRLLRQQPGLCAGFVAELSVVERIGRRFAEWTPRLRLSGPVFFFVRERLQEPPEMDGAMLVPHHPSLERYIDRAAQERAMQEAQRELDRLRTLDSETQRQTEAWRQDREDLQRYLMEWPADRVARLHADTQTAQAALTDAAEAIQRAEQEAAQANQRLAASVKAERVAQTRCSTAEKQEQVLAALYAKHVEPWEAQTQLAASAQERRMAAAASRQELDTRYWDIDTLKQKKEEKKQVLLTEQRVLERERDKLPASAQTSATDDATEDLVGLQRRYDAACAAFAEEDAVRRLLEGQLEEQQAHARKEGARAAQLIAAFDPVDRAAVLCRASDPRFADTWRYEAELAAAQKALIQRIEEHSQAERSLGQADYALKEARAALPEQTPGSISPGEESVDALRRYLEARQAFQRQADADLLDSQANLQESERAVRHIEAMLEDFEIAEHPAEPAPLDETALRALRAELKQIGAQLGRARSQQQQDWQRESATFQLLRSSADGSDGLNAKVGQLGALYEAHSAGDWPGVLALLKQTAAALVSLREAAEQERQRLLRDRSDLVEDFVRVGETLEQRLREIEPLSRVHIGAVDRSMLSIHMARSTPERARTRADELFERYLKAVSDGRKRPDQAQLDILDPALLLRCVLEGDPEVRFLKPQPDMAAARPVSWEVAYKWSGGESFVTGLVLLMALMAYRAAEAGGNAQRQSQFILLDNPVGKVNSPHLLRIVFEMAQRNGFQLIAFTGIREPGVVALFERAVSVTKIPCGRRFFVTVDREDTLPQQAGRYAQTDMDTVDLRPEISVD